MHVHCGVLHTVLGWHPVWALNFDTQLLVNCHTCLCLPLSCAVLVLKLVICPLAALALVRLLQHVEAPLSHKIPVAPLASVIEIGIKMAGKST